MDNLPVLLSDQIAYYRARAAEYDDWWFRRGRFDRGTELNTAWCSDVAAVEAALVEFLERAQPRTVLELACGTGLFTRMLAPRAERLLAVDASPEVLAINRARVARDNVEYIEADLFSWSPPRRFDMVFMSFWLSHVPEARFAEFWRWVGAALADRGAAYIIDSAHDSTSTAVDHARPDAKSGIVTRRLNDGREFRIVKVFHQPDDLAVRLGELGWASDLAQTTRYFVFGGVCAGSVSSSAGDVHSG